MLRILLFGTGKVFETIIGGILHNNGILGYNIVGLIDNDEKKYGTEIYGYKVHHPGEIDLFQYDDIILCCDNNIDDILSQLIYGYHVKKEHIKDRWFLLKVMLFYKYKDTNNLEIQHMLNYLKSDVDNKSIVFADFISCRKPVYSSVYWDEKINMPYIFFDTIDGQQRKMYYPRNYEFEIVDGMQYVVDLLHEQGKDSPHLYTKVKHNIQEGDILADIGVCEGNFSLRYINIVKKVYLFECSLNWQEALWYTFEDDIDKVFLVNRAVSNRTGIRTVRLDDVIQGKLNFLKMDIEGCELDGLWGAANVLKKNSVKCSICSYHKFGDEFEIKNILEEYGYTTSVSNGYMAFIYDTDIFYHVDLRRGIVYGDK